MMWHAHTHTQADDPWEPGPTPIKGFHEDVHEEVQRVQRVPAAVTALEMALGLATVTGQGLNEAAPCVGSNANPHVANQVAATPNGLPDGGGGIGV
jgi:hypothetical protein